MIPGKETDLENTMKTAARFWNWIRDEDGTRVLRLEGPIDVDDFWGDSITPKAFRDELESDTGDITLWINSPGGSVFAAAEIYTMLRDYPGKVTVKIASIAASAASVVAMAGDTVLMSPTALLFIHDPMTLAVGNKADMEKAIATLEEVKESILNAYVAKTGQRRSKISALMSNETWLNAKKALEYGFADAILFEDGKKTPDEGKSDDGSDDEPGKDNEDSKKEKPVTLKEAADTWQYSTKIMDRAILNRLGCFHDKAEGCIPEASMDQETASEDISESMESVMDAAEEAPAENEMIADSAVEAVTETESPVEAEAETSAEPEMTADSTVEAMTETESPIEDTTQEQPIMIGMDGKTKDGAMPYELLRKQLEYLR